MAQGAMGYFLQHVQFHAGQFGSSVTVVANWLFTGTGVAGHLRDTCREYLELDTRRQIFRSTYRYVINRFPHGRVLALPRPPLISVTSVEYLDVDNVLRTLSSAMYVVHTAPEPGCVELLPGLQWPVTLDVHSAVRVLFQCGYGDNDTLVPQSLTMAFVVLGRHAEEELADPITTDTFRSLQTMPPVYERLVNPLRFIWDPPD